MTYPLSRHLPDAFLIIYFYIAVPACISVTHDISISSIFVENVPAKEQRAMYVL